MPLLYHRWLPGQGLVEYALIILFVAIALVAALVGLRSGLAEFYSSVSSAFAS